MDAKKSKQALPPPLHTRLSLCKSKFHLGIANAVSPPDCHAVIYLLPATSSSQPKPLPFTMKLVLFQKSWSNMDPVTDHLVLEPSAPPWGPPGAGRGLAGSPILSPSRERVGGGLEPSPNLSFQWNQCAPTHWRMLESLLHPWEVYFWHAMGHGLQCC